MDHSSGLVFRRPQAASPRRSVVYFCSAVLRELSPEVGSLLSAAELAHTASHRMLVPAWNYFTLRTNPAGYGVCRRKQLDLIELAFLKKRRRRGECDPVIERRERILRARIEHGTQTGVDLGVT